MAQSAHKSSFSPEYLHFLVHTLPFPATHFHFTIAQIVINCTLKYIMKCSGNIPEFSGEKTIACILFKIFLQRIFLVCIAFKCSTSLFIYEHLIASESSGSPSPVAKESSPSAIALF